ncbi:ribonuclease P protein subunit p20-like [Camelus ferus]|uniref:Ribonuclease P protein subunit p20 n=1 Tax=Camelus ferus TaxID=419612 RepID=A0A8B6YCU4_CAMFR|nr:ribonuclease P protein subunit p20-like [Camelus ferus]
MTNFFKSGWAGARGRRGGGRGGGAETAGRREAQNSAENREPRGAVETELDPVENTLRTRLPHRRPRRPNDIYVNTKTDFKAQLARCQLLLDGGARGQNARTEIYIHGLGLAINRAISIALQLHAGSFGPLKVATSTSTVELADELEPETDTREPLTRIRSNSAIHTRVFRVTPR